ncbi:MAG: class I SAM-dependent methyltransferase [Patescibacteria group bacterium]
MIYERGNSAKQWIMAELDREFWNRPAQFLDLAGGSGRIWKTYLERHPMTKVFSVDFDRHAIAEGKKMYEGNEQIQLRVFDAQQPVEQVFDAVTAMSAIEHVVDRPAFLRTVWLSLKSGGKAYLNYDVGHFRSHDLKERLMVPISQLLALFHKEGSYMKKVDDALFCSQSLAQGFQVLGMMKHNLHPLKGFMRGASDESLNKWFEFEDSLNAQFVPDKLDRIMWSTTLILQKP